MLVRFQTDAKGFSLLKNVQTGPGIHSMFSSMFTGAPFYGSRVASVVPMLRRSGFIHPLLSVPLYHVQGPHRGHAVAQLVEALRYKPEGRGFDS